MDTKDNPIDSEEFALNIRLDGSKRVPESCPTPESQNDSLSILHHYNLSTQPKYEKVEMLLSTQNMQFYHTCPKLSILEKKHSGIHYFLNLSYPT